MTDSVEKLWPGTRASKDYKKQCQWHAPRHNEQRQSRTSGTWEEPNTTHRSFSKLRWLESMTMDTKDMSLKEKPALLENAVNKRQNSTSNKDLRAETRCIAGSTRSSDRTVTTCRTLSANTKKREEHSQGGDVQSICRPGQDEGEVHTHDGHNTAYGGRTPLARLAKQSETEDPECECARCVEECTAQCKPP